MAVFSCSCLGGGNLTTQRLIGSNSYKRINKCLRTTSTICNHSPGYCYCTKQALLFQKMGCLSMIDEFHVLTTLSVHKRSVMQRSIGKGGRDFNYFMIDVFDGKHSIVAVNQNNSLLRR